jgi:MFS family permease
LFSIPLFFSAPFLYLLGVSVLAVVLGIQIIVLPWLVVDTLSLGSVWVGWVQATLLVPNLLFLLVGGALADKAKALPWLVPLLCLNVLVHAALSVVVYQGVLSIVILLLYAVLLGMSNAFIQPWREYLLKQVKDDNAYELLQKLVAKSSLCLYVGQAVGIAIASTMDVIGADVLLLIQAIMVGLGAISFVSLRRLLFTTSHDVAAESEASQALLFSGIWLGIQDILRLPDLRTLIAIVAFNGFFHIGVFIVALPLMVQQVYGENILFYSGLQLAFVVGTIMTTLVVVLRGGLDSAGRRIIFSLLYGGVILLALSARPTLAGLFTLVFFWGVVVGVSSNMGRSVLQSLAPEVSRGRVISLYQLALFGCAPLGALFAGYAIELWGVLTLFKISGMASLVVFMATMTTRSLWDVEVNS